MKILTCPKDGKTSIKVVLSDDDNLYLRCAQCGDTVVKIDSWNPAHPIQDDVLFLAMTK